jgi:hypothetical protein
MKYLKIIYIFFALSFFSNAPCVGVEQSSANAIIIHSSPTQQFVGYLKNVVAVLKASGTTSADWALNRVQIVENLLIKIDNLFIFGAFERISPVQAKFYEIFENISVRKWPTPSLVREWRKNFNEYKNFLLTVHFASKTSDDALRELDHKAVDAIVQLYQELIGNVFTEEFFDFSTLELLADACVIQPLEFTRDHPFLVGGSCVLLAAGAYLAYNYFGKKGVAPAEEEEEEDEGNEEPLVEPSVKDKPKAGEKDAGAKPKSKPKIIAKPKIIPTKSDKDPNVKVVLGSQSAADCAIQSLYRQWCYEQTGDLETYENLTKNKKQYAAFKKFAKGILVKARLAPLAEEDHAREKRKVTTDWLENQDVREVLDGLNKAAEKKQKFGIKGTRLNPYLVDSYQYLAPDRVEGQMYEDLELKDSHGDPVVYGDKEAAQAAKRLAKSKPRGDKQGLRYQAQGIEVDEPGFRHFIENFLAEPGNTFDFIINSNEMPGQARPEHAKNPPADGHFFHVRAINDPQVDQGIRFIISESMRPNYRIIDNVVDGLRFLLRPYEE